MSEKPFEDYLVENFSDWAKDRIKPGFRYQFRSPDAENSTHLYNALATLCMNSISDEGVELGYFERHGVRIVPILHGEMPGACTEFYISKLRDRVAGQGGVFLGTCLLLLHNSFLDTIINSALDLAAPGQVWHPRELKGRMERLLIKNNPVSKCLLQTQFEIVLSEGTTVFGLKPLYRALQDGQLEFHELGLFNDPLLHKFDDSPLQIRRRLEDNRKLREELEFEAHYYPGQLEDRLKKLDFGEKFIKEHFGSGGDWRGLDYSVIQSERDKNQNQQLKLESYPDGDFVKILSRPRGQTKAGSRDISVILLRSPEQQGSTLTIPFSGGELKLEEVRIRYFDKIEQNSEIERTITRRGGGNQIRINVPHLDFPTFFNVELNRPKTSEQFKFRFVCLPSFFRLVDYIENCFRVDPLRRQLIIETEETQLRIGVLGDRTVELVEGLEQVSVEDHDIVDFSQLAQETDSLGFTVREGSCILKLCIEGSSIQTEPVQLPYILNRTSMTGLLCDESNVVFNPAKNKIVIDRLEIPVVGVRQTLLNEEFQLVSTYILARTKHGEVTLAELHPLFPELHHAYLNLFDYYRTHSTLPSLVAWGPKYVDLVRHVVHHYLSALRSIAPNNILESTQKMVVNLGFFQEAERGEKIAPFHPLLLCYHLELASRIRLDSELGNGPVEISKNTIDRLSPQGLVPYIFDSASALEYSQVHSISELPSWMRLSPPRDADYPFVSRLIRDKILEFSSAYLVLFDGRPDGGTLLINCVNQSYAEQILFGIRDYFLKADERCLSIHISFFDTTLEPNAFDRLADTNEQELREWLGLQRALGESKSDQILQLLRTKLSYSRFPSSAKATYAHLCFFSNSNPVKYEQYVISDALCGILADGFISGPAAERKQESYFSGFGLRNCDNGSPLIEMAGLLNALLRPARRSTTPYILDQGYGLMVDTEFRAGLRNSFNSAIWTTLIDPKVNLDFFESDEEIVLIHYSDQYTSTAGYDAITVTPQRAIFSELLSSREQIAELNAFNGTWLLEMLTKQPRVRKERMGIIGAYKFLSSILSTDAISWVPLSVAEMIRVSGNIGLKLSESDFSRHIHGYSRGAISDDVLFVGFAESKMLVFALEVKAGAYPDFEKASRQALELSRFMLEDLLQGRSLARQLNRSLFVRQVLMQLEKYRLYRFLEDSKLRHLLERKEWWLQGRFDVGPVPNYPNAAVLAYVDSKACYNPKYKTQDKVLRIELPYGLMDHSVEFKADRIEELSNHYAVPEKYLLRFRTGFTQESDVEFPADAQHIPHSLEEQNADPILPDEESSVIPDLHRGTLKALLGRKQFGGDPLWWEPTNTNRFLNPNSGIIGTMGTGKTQFTKSVITQLVQNQHLNVGGKPVGVLIFDYKSDYVDSAFLEATRGKKYSLHNLPFNPLSLHGDMPMLPVHTANHFADTMTRAYRLGPKQKTRLKDLILEAYGIAGISRSDSATWGIAAPSLQNVWNIYQSQDKVEIDSLHAALSSLIDFQIFEVDASKMMSLYDLTQGVTVIELAGHSPDVQNLVVGLTLDLFYAQMQKSGKPALEGDHRQLAKIILVDEADNFMSQDFASLRKLLKEGREYGVGVVLSTQDITHFQTSENNYASYILTWVIHRVAQIKNSDIKAIFNVDDKSGQASLMEDVRKLEKHHSLFVDGEKSITRMRDYAFFELMAEKQPQ